MRQDIYQLIFWLLQQDTQQMQFKEEEGYISDLWFWVFLPVVLENSMDSGVIPCATEYEVAGSTMPGEA